jgi:gliding motility-associated-like protein
MKNYIYSAIVLFLLSFNTFGQAPNWTVKENDFQYTMTFVGALKIDGVRLDNLNDKVAAFVNGECRGVSNLIYVASEKKYYAYLTVFSNTNYEALSFKIYDSAKSVVKDVAKNISFESNANSGNLSHPYIFSNITLQQGADISDVGFIGVSRNDMTIVGNDITLYLNPGQNLTNLNTTFVVSPEATVFVRNVQLASGSNTIDFTNPVSFKVFSEDQTNVKEWTVSVKLPVYPVTLPTTFTLSKWTIDENQPVAAAVGDFNVFIEDRKVSDLSLVAGDGEFDNDSFEIIGNTLKVKSIFDFEAKNNYKIRVKAVSIRKEVLEKTFEITVKDDNLPTIFSLSKVVIDENKAIGTIVGDFTVVKEDRSVFALSLIQGDGSEDNASFEIVGNALKVRSIFDFEAKSNYRIRVQAVSTRGDVLVQTFEVTVKDDNLPTVFTLSKLTIDENKAIGTVLGDFTVVKEDRNVFALTLVDGLGAEDNASFEIIGNALKVKSIFDFEAKSNYRIRVKAVSARGDVLEQAFEITVKDDNLPTVFTLSKTETAENLPVGSIIGDFTAVKENRNVFDVSLVAGLGGDDNASFEIVNNQLRIKEIFDFETKSNYKVRVQAKNALNDLLFQTFIITIKDDNLPTIFTLSKLSISENQPLGSIVGDFIALKEDRKVFALTLVVGDGGEDNASFEIIGNALKVKSVFDFEAKNNYRIRVQAVSARGDVLEQAFEVAVIDDNLPTVFTLSKDNIDENLADGSIIGDLVVAKENRNNFTLSLIDGDGGEDNASFELVGNVLKSKLIFDFETKKAYRIRIKAENTTGEVLYSNFVINVNDINDIPVLITSSNYDIKENLEVGELIGILTTKDQDKDLAKYRFLIKGTDYTFFDVIDNQLVLKQAVDFETQNSFQFDLISNDGKGGEVTESLTIKIIDINENPVILNADTNNLIAFSIPELDLKDTIIGKIEITDQDKADEHTYNIVSDETLPFAINNEGIIFLVGVIDYEKKSKYSFQVVVTDNGMPQLSDAVTVEVEIEDEIETTLAFNNFVSPNNDGKNDYLVIENIQLYKDYNLSIYNVRGQLVFTAVNYKNDWTGDGLPEGEYYLYFIGKDQGKKEFVYKEVVRLVSN